MPDNKWSLERLRSESSYWRACTLITAAHLELFAWIGKRQRRPAALAAHFGGKPEGWETFLNALCAMSLLRKRGGKYSNTSFSARHLGRARANFLLPEFDAWKIWGGLDSALITGKRPNTHIPFFSDEKKAERLLRALDYDVKQIAPDLIARLPLSRSETLLDLGGGLGGFAIAFCLRYPGLHATIIEHPRVASLARHAVRQAGLLKRVRVIGVDFTREALPRCFDTVFVSNVLHSQGVDENRSLIGKIRHCLNSTGQLILRDVFMDKHRTAPEWATLFSVSLLLQTPRGRCYGLDEILGWLRGSGFSDIKGPFRSSKVPFDPDSILIAKR
jgi:precorrin-6B methylase 2